MAENVCKCYLYDGETECYGLKILEEITVKKPPPGTSERRKLKKAKQAQKKKRTKQFFYDIGTHCRRVGGYIPIVTRPDSHAPLPPTPPPYKTLPFAPLEKDGGQTQKSSGLKGNLLAPMQAKPGVSIKSQSHDDLRQPGRRKNRKKGNGLPVTLEQRMAMFNLTPETLHTAQPGRLKAVVSPKLTTDNSIIKKKKKKDKNIINGKGPAAETEEWIMEGGRSFKECDKHVGVNDEDKQRTQPSPDLISSKAFIGDGGFSSKVEEGVSSVAMQQTLQPLASFEQIENAAVEHHQGGEYDEQGTEMMAEPLLFPLHQAKEEEGELHEIDDDLQRSFAELLHTTTSLDPMSIGGRMEGLSPPAGAAHRPGLRSDSSFLDHSGEEEGGVAEAGGGGGDGGVLAPSSSSSSGPPSRLMTPGAERGDPTAFLAPERGLAHLSPKSAGRALERAVDAALFRSWRGLPWQARVCPAALEAADRVRLARAVREEEARAAAWRARAQRRAADRARALDRRLRAWSEAERAAPPGPAHAAVAAEAAAEEARLGRWAAAGAAAALRGLARRADDLDRAEEEALAELWRLHVRCLGETARPAPAAAAAAPAPSCPATSAAAAAGGGGEEEEEDASRLVGRLSVHDAGFWDAWRRRRDAALVAAVGPDSALGAAVRAAVAGVAAVEARTWLDACGVGAVLATQAKEKSIALIKEDIAEAERIEKSSAKMLALVKRSWQDEVAAMEELVAGEEKHRALWHRTQAAVARAVAAHVAKVLTPASLGGLGGGRPGGDRPAAQAAAAAALLPEEEEAVLERRRAAVLARCRAKLSALERRARVAEGEAAVVREAWDAALLAWRDRARADARARSGALLGAVRARRREDEVAPLRESRRRLRAARAAIKTAGVQPRSRAAATALGRAPVLFWGGPPVATAAGAAGAAGAAAAAACPPALAGGEAGAGAGAGAAGAWGGLAGLLGADFGFLAWLRGRLEGFEGRCAAEGAAFAGEARGALGGLRGRLEGGRRAAAAAGAEAEEAERRRVRDGEAAAARRRGEAEAALAREGLRALGEALGRARTALSLGALGAASPLGRAAAAAGEGSGASAAAGAAGASAAPAGEGGPEQRLSEQRSGDAAASEALAFMEEEVVAGWAADRAAALDGAYGALAAAAGAERERLRARAAALARDTEGRRAALAREAEERGAAHFEAQGVRLRRLLGAALAPPPPPAGPREGEGEEEEQAVPDFEEDDLAREGLAAAAEPGVAAALEVLDLFEEDEGRGGGGGGGGAHRDFRPASGLGDRRRFSNHGAVVRSGAAGRVLALGRRRRAWRLWALAWGVLKGLCARALARAHRQVATTGAALEAACPQGWAADLAELVRVEGVAERRRFQGRCAREAARVRWRRDQEAEAEEAAGAALEAQAGAEAKVAARLAGAALAHHGRVREMLLRHEVRTQKRIHKLAVQHRLAFQDPNQTLDRHRERAAGMPQEERELFSRHEAVVKEWRESSELFWKEAKEWCSEHCVEAKRLTEEFSIRATEWAGAFRAGAAAHGGNAYAAEEAARAEAAAARRAALHAARGEQGSILIEKELKAWQSLVEDQCTKIEDRVWEMLVTISVRNIMDGLIVDTEILRAAQIKEEEEKAPPRRISVSLLLDQGGKISLSALNSPDSRSSASGAASPVHASPLTKIVGKTLGHFSVRSSRKSSAASAASSRRRRGFSAGRRRGSAAFSSSHRSRSSDGRAGSGGEESATAAAGGEYDDGRSAASEASRGGGGAAGSSSLSPPSQSASPLSRRSGGGGGAAKREGQRAGGVGGGGRAGALLFSKKKNRGSKN